MTIIYLDSVSYLDYRILLDLLMFTAIIAFFFATRVRKDLTRWLYCWILLFIGFVTQDMGTAAQDPDTSNLLLTISQIAGRGFNVVADQVRKLAEESRKSAGSSEALLKEITEITDKQAMNSYEILKAFDTIAIVAEETSASTEETAAAAEEQSASMGSIATEAQNLQTLAEKLSELKSKSTQSDE